MNRNHENLESLLIDYIDEKLGAEDKQMIEQELVNNPESYALYEQLKEVITRVNKAKMLEPSENLKERFDRMLAEEITNQKTKAIFLNPAWYRIAATVALLIVGGGIGYWISVQQQHKSEVLALRKEMELTRQLVFSQLNNEQSASQRMMGVKAAYESVESSNPDAAIVSALINTMNEDDNSNVRLAALEALSRFVDEESVRTALIQSLSKQTDPVVQLALIQLLVDMKEKGAVKSMQQIIDDETSLPAVKDEAHAGIFKLS